MKAITQIQSTGILLFLLCISLELFSQVSSRNGRWTPVHDTLMIFKVYAEYTGDTTPATRSLRQISAGSYM